MTLRFNESLRNYLQVVHSAQGAELADAGKIVIVRDLLGRLRLAIERKPRSPEVLVQLEEKLNAAGGPFAAKGLLVGSEMLSPELVFHAKDEYTIQDMAVLERIAMGADWTREPLPNEDPTPPRATLYGIKGGVGRSLALCAWARYLAQHGQKVLVVDLDLESPGVSSTLLPVDAGPDFGVVDWLVEDAVSNADDELLRLMVAPSRLAEGTAGTILVAPCAGSGDAASDSYLAKLARAYIDLPSSSGGRPFAERIAKMLDALEAEIQPDVVLIDSRAGLHDVAAVATTRLSAMTFLFAVGNRQTWDGYRKLLRQWQRRPNVGREVRERLRIVAAQIPETARDHYLQQFDVDAYNLFADTLYEEANREHPNAFNFDINAQDAPHYRLPIYWSRAMQDWDPLDNQVSDSQIEAAFGSFLKGATDLLLDVTAPAADGTAPTQEGL